MANVKKFVAKAIYDFSVDAGAASTIVPDNSAIIPNNAVVTTATTCVTTACTSGGSATVAITAGGITLVAQQNFNHASLADEKVTLNDVGDKTTSATGIQFVIATAALTAGVIECYVEYYLGPESA